MAACCHHSLVDLVVVALAPSRRPAHRRSGFQSRSLVGQQLCILGAEQWARSEERLSWIALQGLIVASVRCQGWVIVHGLVSGGSHGLQREQSAVGAGTLAVAGSVAAEAASTVPDSNVLCCAVDKIADCN